MRLAILVIALSGCMIFDESMRRSHADGGAQESSSGAATSSSGAAETCSVTASGGGGAGGCPGTAAETYDGTVLRGASASLTRERAVCGEGTAQLSLTVSADECVNVFFSGTSGTARVTGPDGETETLRDTSSVGLHATSAGTITIDVQSSGTWKLVAR